MIQTFIKKHFVLLLAIALYLAISFPYHLDGNHILYNLEPYPDSFGYLTPVHNLLQGNGFSYSFQGNEIIQRMPPLYSVILIPGYILFQSPISFYFSNLLLGIFTLIGVSFLVNEIVPKKQTHLYTSVALLLYLAHSYIYLLAATPMAENLVLPLFIWALYFLFKNKVDNKDAIYSGLLITGLLLTKYVYVAVAITFGLLFLLRLHKSKDYKQLQYFIASCLLLLFALFLYLYSLSWSSFKFVSDFASFSTSYILTGVKFYSDAILGEKTRFLWYNASLTSGLFIISIFLAFFISLRKKTKLLSTVILYFAHFVMVVPYFYLDTRFVISLAPLNIIIFILLMNQLKISLKTFALFTAILLISLVVNQSQLYKQVIGQNILGNTRAWQYEAVHSLGKYMNTKEGTLITALHPPLFSLYGYDSISLLPISNKQEFYKDQIWGDINSDIESEINIRLENEEVLFISNAYITAIQSYHKSFESLKSKYNFELVSSGCMEACNIYRVEKKPNL